MRLNDTQARPRVRARTRRRVGRGIGSGLGKTAGRGHKGQHARAGNTHKLVSKAARCRCSAACRRWVSVREARPRRQQVFLYQLASLKHDAIDVAALREARLIDSRAKRVKIVKKGEIGRAVKLTGVLATAGAKAAIEAAGGSVE